eukprot:UN18107
MSKGAVFRLKPVLESLRTTGSSIAGKAQCIDRPGASEDRTLAVCLRQIGINPLNTLDENLRNRFLTFRVEDHDQSMWSHDPRDGDSYYWKYKPKYMGDTEIGAVSEHLISSHGHRGPVKEMFIRMHEKYR